MNAHPNLSLLATWPELFDWLFIWGCIQSGESLANVATFKHPEIVIQTILLLLYYYIVIVTKSEIGNYLVKQPDVIEIWQWIGQDRKCHEMVTVRD